MRHWVKTTEVMARLGVTRGRVSQLLQEGRLVGQKDINGAWQIAAESLDRCHADQCARREQTAEQKEKARVRALENAEIVRRNRRLDEKRQKEKQEQEQARIDREIKLLKVLERIAEALET